MANGITSNKGPAKMKGIKAGNKQLYAAGIAQFAGDPVAEALNGQMGRLNAIEQQPLSNITEAQKDAIFAEAGHPRKRINV